MKQRLLFIFCLILSVSGVAVAQRSITNADLDRYRESRLVAEREYRENHQRLGLPSPEELAVRREKSQAELTETSERLRAARLERERLAVERERIEGEYEAERLKLAAAYIHRVPSSGFFDGFSVVGFGPVFPPFHHGRRLGHFRRGARGQEGYFAGGQFWPTGPRTRPRPLIEKQRIPRPRR